MSDMTIEIDERTGKFRLRCPVWANDALSGLDAKSFSKAQKAWLIPISRATVDYLQRQIIGPGLAAVTDEVLKVMHDGVRPPVAKGAGFPAWYPFKTQPRKHQHVALQKWSLPNLALFMIMRAGKTKVAIDRSAALAMSGHIDSVLVVVKLSVRRTWLEQFELHCPLPYDGFLPVTDHKARFMRWLEKPFDGLKLCVVGMESLSQGGMKELAHRFMEGRKVHVVIDEHTMIANHKAERTQVCIELGRKAKYKTIMSGSSMDEGPMLVFAPFEFLDTNIIGIGDFYAFRNRYAVMGGYHVEIRPGVKKPTKIVGYQNLEELAKLIAPYTVEVGEDQLDLPPVVREKRYVQMTEHQWNLYRQIRRTGEYQFKDEHIVIKNCLEMELRLHQIAGGWTVRRAKDAKGKDITVPEPLFGVGEKYKPNPKVVELIDVLGEAGVLSHRSRAIVWCAYRPEISEVTAHLKGVLGLRVGEIHGGIPEDEREAVRLRLQRGELDVVVANTATGSMGLDMSAADTMVFYSNGNKNIDRVQAESRPKAIGKKTSILCIDIIAENTVDELRMEALEQKKDLADYMKDRLRDAIKYFKENDDG